MRSLKPAAMTRAKLLRAYVDIEVLAKEIGELPMTAFERASYYARIAFLRKRAKVLLAQMSTGPPSASRRVRGHA